ncbi:MAG: hypothetical protein GTO02_03365, partial [Candidatus Dadabacteria bacterium]|nr:hypothetical protein [Candidatus Dadabacteria bacterium]NIQ13467.1 hypothetical protein [Candidatus Dadabacteria bacterium]
MFKKLLIVSAVLILIIVAFLFRSKIETAIEYAKISLIPEEKILEQHKAKQIDPWLKLKLTKAFEGFDQPIYLTNAGDGSKRIFVVEKKGLIKVIENGKILDDPFLDITDRVGSKETERGLLSIAFHPQYTRNRRVIVYYTNKDGDVIVSEFTAKEKNIADNTKEKVIIKIEQPAANHNGGHLAFGPDRNLYISVGDGGSSGDPWNNAQNLENMLGKMLRINVNSRLTEYAIPYLNPFLRTKTANSKIWSYGLRNPWRFSI